MMGKKQSALVRIYLILFHCFVVGVFKRSSIDFSLKVSKSLQGKDHKSFTSMYKRKHHKINMFIHIRNRREHFKIVCPSLS